MGQKYIWEAKLFSSFCYFLDNEYFMHLFYIVMKTKSRKVYLPWPFLTFSDSHCFYI